MSYRQIPVNAMLAIVLGIGSALGLRKKIEVSDHSVTVELVAPDTDTRAWDPDLFKKSNIFVSGYANPIKPRVDYHENLENPDTVDVKEAATDGGETVDDDKHVSLISSARYRDYMRQDLVSQLLTPQEQWKLIAYGILGLGILLFFQLIITVWINGGAPT